MLFKVVSVVEKNETISFGNAMNTKFFTYAGRATLLLVQILSQNLKVY